MVNIKRVGWIKHRFKNIRIYYIERILWRFIAVSFIAIFISLSYLLSLISVMDGGNLLESDLILFQDEIFETVNDLNDDAIITIPIEYTEKYKNSMFKNGIYSPEMSDVVEIKKSDLPKGRFQTVIYKDKAYITLNSQIVKSVLDVPHDNNTEIISRGIIDYKDRSVSYKKVMNAQEIAIALEKMIIIIAFMAYILTPIALSLLSKYSTAIYKFVGKEGWY